MYSFTAVGVGTLARNPEIIIVDDVCRVRFCLVAGDVVEDQNGETREVMSSVWFTAFDDIGDAIHKKARKGDQLIVHGYIQPRTLVEEGGRHYHENILVVTDYRFGAKREASTESVTG